MNLEDFKSFRRVLIPSEVGSIPTHSRQGFLGLFVVGLLLVAPGQKVCAQELDGPSGFNRAVRSAVFPGWGQLTNGKKKKTVLLFSFQTYLFTRIILETRGAKEADRFAAGAATDETRTIWEADAQDHYNTRRDLFFWAIVTSFYGAIDAYVDTYLGDFEKDLEEGRELFGGMNEDGTALEFGIRF